MTRLSILAAAVAITLAAGFMAWRLSKSPVAENRKESTMQWSLVQDVTVPAKPTGLWTWAVDYVKGPAAILVEASGTWGYSTGRSCGPDGDLGALLGASRTVLPSAPTGALLVKIGGSTAGLADGKIRVAGSKAYFEIDAASSGPLFLSINDEPGGMSDNSGEMKVKISVATIAAPAPPAGDAKEKEKG